jgi:hypothetical protein
MIETGGDFVLQAGEVAEWSLFSASEALAAFAAGAHELFRLQGEAIDLIVKRLERGDRLLPCLFCGAPLALDVAAAPGLVGVVRPVKREAIGVFVLCYDCSTDRSDDFRQRLLAAIIGEGAIDIPGGRA